MGLGYSVPSRVWPPPSSALLFRHLLRPAKKQLEGAFWGCLLGGGPPQNARTTGELLPVYCDVVALHLWFLPCLLMVAVDILFSTRRKRQLSDGLENIMKSLAKVAKSGAELAGRGTPSGPTSRAAFPRCEFSEHSTASVGQGTPSPHTSLIFFTNLTSLRESFETRAAAPSSRSATGCSSGRGDSCSAEAGISPDRFLLRLLQSDLLPWPGRETGDGRLQIGRPVGTNLRRRSSAHNRSGAPGQSSERGRTHSKQRNDRAPRVCAFTPANHPRAPKRL